MLEILNENKIDRKVFADILNGWEYFFNTKDFFTNAVFEGTEMDSTRTCKSKYGVLEFKDNYLNLKTKSQENLVFHFGELLPNNNGKIFILRVSYNEKNACIEIKNIPEKIPVLPNDVFQEFGKSQFFENYMCFLQSLEIAEKNFKMNLDEREWE